MEIVNKLGEDYFVICFLGKADCEEDKIFYKNQWMKCYNILDSFMRKAKIKTVCTEQTKVEIKSWGKDHYPRINHKKLALGRTFKWNKNNNEKICETYLNDLLEQMKKAKNECLTHYQWLEKNFPEIKETISFDYHEVIGKINENIDIIFRAYDGSVGNNSYNHEVNIFISKEYLKIANDIVQDFFNDIENLVKAVKIAKTIMPLGIKIKEDGQIKMMTLWTQKFALNEDNNLDLRKNPVEKWEIMK